MYKNFSCLKGVAGIVDKTTAFVVETVSNVGPIKWSNEQQLLLLMPESLEKNSTVKSWAGLHDNSVYHKQKTPN